ncbi:MAG TPA: alpha/beta hydrolase [Planctomycetaceae bacterium]|nr:alpha/beta hydrolase [Blastopirellula sp.]HAY78319.1 alpha/beta hydrolase [Planctomycetaceae bacterium]
MLSQQNLKRFGLIAAWAGGTVLTALVLAGPVTAAEKPNQAQRTPLWQGDQPTSKAAVTVHHPTKPCGTAMIICPGGGYGGLVTGAEGHGIARWLNQHGITGIVLEYELPKGRSMVPLRDAQQAIRWVRSQAQQWGVAANRIGIIGFSAGGHLASTAGTHFDAGQPTATNPTGRLSCRPDFMVLVYPVITMGEQTHRGSKRNLLGTDSTPESVKQFSNELQVTEKTPPAYLAHAKDDRVVVPENSRMFHQALRKHGVASEYLELPSGGHGLNRYQGPMWDAWQSGSLRWLVEQKLLPPAALKADN